MSATKVILKKKLKRDSGKYWDKGETIAVDRIRAKALEASGHIEPMDRPAKEAKPTTSKKTATEEQTDNKNNN